VQCLCHSSCTICAYFVIVCIPCHYCTVHCAVWMTSVWFQSCEGWSLDTQIGQKLTHQAGVTFIVFWWFGHEPHYSRTRFLGRVLGWLKEQQ
jgi:hypothetical protein